MLHEEASRGGSHEGRWLGYRHARAIAVVGLLGALAVAFLRIRADMHWATDTIVGALVGSMIGGGIAMLLHPRAAKASPLAAAPETESARFGDP
jgi:membrane-associated phospholipid phosphatase